MRNLGTAMMGLVGGVCILGVAGHAVASISTYYVYAGVDSGWDQPDNTGDPYYGNYVAPIVHDDQSYLSGSFTIPDSVSQVATFQGFTPTPSSPGTWAANGRGTLVGSLSDAGFSVAGHADASATGDANNQTFTGISSYGQSTVQLDFDVLDTDQVLILNGSVGRSGSSSTLVARFSEFTFEGTWVKDLFDYRDSHVFNGEQFALRAGYAYSLDLWSQVAPDADSTTTGPQTGTSDFNLSGVVPEPGVFGLVLAGGSLLATRRRVRPAITAE